MLNELARSRRCRCDKAFAQQCAARREPFFSSGGTAADESERSVLDDFGEVPSGGRLAKCAACSTLRQYVHQRQVPLDPGSRMPATRADPWQPRRQQPKKSISRPQIAPRFARFLFSPSLPFFSLSIRSAGGRRSVLLVGPNLCPPMPAVFAGAASMQAIHRTLEERNRVRPWWQGEGNRRPDLLPAGSHARTHRNEMPDAVL